MSQPDYIDRPPRIQPILPIAQKRIPAPPTKLEGGLMQLLQVALPVVTIGGFLLVGLFSSAGRSPLLMIPMALSVVAATGLGAYTYLAEKRKQAAVERAYSERLVELSAEMRTDHDLQRRFYSYSYPGTDTTFGLPDDARYELEKDHRTLRTESRLWERRTTDDDFGVVRLGMGTLPSTVLYEVENLETIDDPLARAALKLQEDSRFVTDIPVIISFRPPHSSQNEGADTPENSQAVQQEEALRTPVTHAMGISGDRDAVYKVTRSLLAHFAVFHTPADARLYILANSEREWSWTQTLPHCQGDENSSFTYFLSDHPLDQYATRQGGDEEGPLQRFLEELRRLFTQRKLQLGDKEDADQREDPTIPFCLVVVDLLDTAYNKKSPLYQLESDAAFSILVAEGEALGAAVIFLVPERSKVPGGCKSVLEVERTTPATNSKQGDFQQLHFRYTETGLNTFRYLGAADYVNSRDEMNVLTRKLAQLQVRETFGSKLVSTVPFMTMMGYGSLTALEEDTRRQWTESALPQNADWLRAKVGMMSGKKVRTLTFSAKRDGVHGMIAGSTGSGKSELLISLITAMAVTYDPRALNFVLVDYKGGGAFKEFNSLPHCVDIITNLAGEGVTRMFTAINAELRRRQKLNADTGTKNIVDYRQKGLHLSGEPYPFLFIIIDEFAEMIADRAEYKAELETITRVGRAQGVSLILAAQRPSGVTDQMRSNIKFRISLRVETVGESREMLRRPDAAYLPSGIPGRGYLQVGNDDIELIQLAYSGDKYVDPTVAPRTLVLWPDRGDVYSPEKDQEPPELYKIVIDTLKTMAATLAIPKQRAPWPGFLPTHLSLTAPLLSQVAAQPGLTSERYWSTEEVDRLLLGTPRGEIITLNPALHRWFHNREGWVENMDWEQYAVRPVVGIVDNPYGAKQLPLVVDLPRGHAVLFGASGWGKTMFVRSLVVSLAATHSPGHVHMYVLDLGGRQLGILDKLPHVGGVINPDEDGYKERVEQLLRELESVIEKRKTILSAVGIGDIFQYNAQHYEPPLPAIVVAIDNFTEFTETFGGGSDTVESTLDKFIALTRECKPYGVHFVITASHPGALNVSLSNLFTERFTLKLAEAADYRVVVGNSVPDIADIPGRGYVKWERVALSFQIALPSVWSPSVLETAAYDRDDLSGLIESNDPATLLPSNENDDIVGLANAMTDFMARSGRTYEAPFAIGALPRAVLYKHLWARQHNTIADDTLMTHMERVTREEWERSRDATEADWLKAIFALAPGDKLREMHLEAKKDGVHGLIAGGTGSGKSELLMTMIVGLALSYDPSILNFVLVDYKGGGAFKPFETLPHCVDTMSNLNKTAVRRMFTAINAEMQRRQQLNAETGTKDIVEYRQQGLHLTREPYPHLFIIIDEYAEMISDSPEFKDELESITRVGRAQGVNLILASQRPTGVTDQMRANIKFRICLRVEEVETSREMLRRSDAAFLPNGVPGRGYLQVGNEGLELIQVAWTGEDQAYGGMDTEATRVPKFYEAVVALTQKLADGKKSRTPWPPFLPTAFTFTDDRNSTYLAHPDRVTLGQSVPIAINPFMQHWLEGTGAWCGIDWRKYAMRAIVGLVDDPYHARRLPFIVDISKGHGVVFGASGWGKTTFFRSLVLSLAATHSPDEFQAHILDLGGRNLETLKALPHVGTIIMPDEAGYEERVQQLLRELNNLIDYRKRLFSEFNTSTLYEYNVTATRPEPAILVVIDNFSEYLETFGSSTKENDPNNMLEALVSLVRQGRAYGVHVIISANRLNVLSSKLYSLFTERFALRLADADDYSGIVGGRVPEAEEIAGRGYTRIERQALAFQVALAPDTITPDGQVRDEAGRIRAIGNAMQEHMKATVHVYAVPLRIDALPKSVSHRQIIAATDGIVPDAPLYQQVLNAMRRRWDDTATANNADWLSAALGVMSGNRVRTLHLEAKQDGVHGMIAGGTGSGKSELLMSLIVSLALNYSPDILNFVLVDYKGGGAFKPFESLPHCVDIVTNLNKAAVNRMFTAINAEIRRRQALNVATGTKDIVEYRQKGLHLRGEPYPHLFIIIDEYAEMIDDNPDYKIELESITRVGRAQGINLLLASQRPKGVTDQMRANIKYRLCLRVEQTDTSVEMLRRPDAAFLPNGIPGRGYLQVGNDNLELIQISYTGEKQPDDRPVPVLWHDSAIQSHVTPDEPPHFFDMAVALSREIRAETPVQKPWPAFLPLTISLQSPVDDGRGTPPIVLEPTVTEWLNHDIAGWRPPQWRDEAMRPVVGWVDDPSEARQFPLRFNLTSQHLVIYGDSGWGKTSFLRSLIVSLATTHSPNLLHMYVLDLGGRNFRSLDALPHIGAIIYADDSSYEERLYRLFEKLTRLTDERSRLLSNTGTSNLYEYNDRFPDTALPALLIAIDNFAPLHETQAIFVENVLLPLVRRSLQVGMSFVVTANAPGNITSKLVPLFNQRITFKQTNPERYMDIVGRGAIDIDDIPGRGYIQIRRRPLSFQAALPVGVFDRESGRDKVPEAEEINRLAQIMRTTIEADGFQWNQRPDPIETLAKIVPLHELLQRTPPVRPQRIEAVVGVGGDLRPMLFDVRQLPPHFMVTGPTRSGKTTLLYSWLLSLAHRYTPEQVLIVIIDLQRKFARYRGHHTLHDLPHVIETVYEMEKVAPLLLTLKQECDTWEKEGSREIFIIIDDFDNTIDEIEAERTSTMPRDLATLAQKYGQEGLHFVVASDMTGSTNSDLKRRIQKANFGLGLRVEQSLTPFNLSRTPPGINGKELPTGRGYMVRSGQADLLQVATLYDISATPTSEERDKTEQLAKELDTWVNEIIALHGTQKAIWRIPTETAPITSNGTIPVRSPLTIRMMHVLRMAMRDSARRLSQQGNSGSVLLSLLGEQENAFWSDESTLIRLLKEVWREQKRLREVPADSYEFILTTMDDVSVIMEVEAALRENDEQSPMSSGDGTTIPNGHVS